MSEPIWNQFLTERDKQVFSAAGYGARAGFGKRPALLVIDVSYAFTGDKPGEPILESIKRWRNSCGAESWVAIGHIKKLIDKKVTMPQIVFATAFDQYAVKAFEVNAVDYLLKPFDKKRVAQSVQKTRAELQQ